MSKSKQASISNSNNEVLEQLTRPLKLSFPVIKVQTFEIARAELALEDAAEKVGKHFHKMEFQQIPSPPEIQKIAKEAEKQNKEGTVIFDSFFFDRQKSNPGNMPAFASVDIDKRKRKVILD